MSRTKTKSPLGDEWQTPPWLVQMCADAMGISRFDVDMYSNDLANETVKAKKHFTKENPIEDYPDWNKNGQLTVFCNPPGSLKVEAWRLWLQTINHGHLAVWIGFSMNALPMMGRYTELIPLHYPTVLLSKRVQYLRPDIVKSRPTDMSYVTFSKKRYAKEFTEMYERKHNVQCATLGVDDD